MSAPAAEPVEDGKLARLRALAEGEMRRRLPPAKRHKGAGGGGGGSGEAGGSGSAGALGAGGGRFDYSAIKELATGLTGFLLTCPLQRENSARKEALPLLQRYLVQQRSVGALQNEGGTASGSDSKQPALPAAVAKETAGDEEEAAAAVPSAAGGAAQVADEVPPTAAPAADAGGEERAAAGKGPAGAPGLAAIKVACRGVVAFKLAAPPAAPAGGGGNGGANSGLRGTAAASAALVQRAAAALLEDVGSGRQPRLSHVQRIIPVHTTCRLERAALEGAGAQLAALVAAALAAQPAGNGAAATGAAAAAATTGAAAGAAAGDSAPAAPLRRITFGIALKQRALEVAGGGKEGAQPAAPGGAAGSGPGEDAPAAAAADATASTGGAAEAGGAAATDCGTGSSSKPLDRGAIISALAAGFEAALRGGPGPFEAAVDLRAPDWVLVVEVLPAAGALYAALCALPAHLCVLKPKLHIRPVGKGAA